jgi:hypothetical protein
LLSEGGDPLLCAHPGSVRRQHSSDEPAVRAAEGGTLSVVRMHEGAQHCEAHSSASGRGQGAASRQCPSPPPATVNSTATLCKRRRTQAVRIDA